VDLNYGTLGLLLSDRPSLISLDISGNAIGYRSLSKWLDLLSKSYVEKLKLDSILNLSASDKFIG